MVNVSEVRFTGVEARERSRGLLGYVSFLVDGALRVDGVTLRKTQAGRVMLAYPSRKDGRGLEHPYVRPIREDVRRRIEHQVLKALALEFES